MRASTILISGWLLLGLSPSGGPGAIHVGYPIRTYKTVGACEGAAQAELDAARVAEIRPVGSPQAQKGDFFADATIIYPDGYVCVKESD